MGLKENGSHPYMPDGYEDDDDGGVLNTIGFIFIALIGLFLVKCMELWDAAREKFKSLLKGVE